MEKNIGIQLTLWQEDSPASHSRLQENEKELTMTAISGLKCLESSKKPNQDGLLERMFLGSSIWHSTMCKLTWKENITKSGNSYYRLLPSMRDTEETASSLLPTPTAQQYGTSQNGKRKDGTTYKQAGKPSLHTMARHNLWPTPTSMNGGEKVAPSHKDGSHGWNTGAAVQDSLSDNPTKLWPTPTVHGNYNKKGISKKSGDGLATAVNRMWPTATARDWRSGKTSEKTMNRNSRPLNEVVVSEEKMWPTPMAHEARLGYQDRSRGKKGTQESLTTKVINNLGGRKSVSGQLNPAWVEWLMGFPIGWTELKD